MRSWASRREARHQRVQEYNLGTWDSMLKDWKCPLCPCVLPRDGHAPDAVRRARLLAHGDDGRKLLEACRSTGAAHRSRLSAISKSPEVRAKIYATRRADHLARVAAFGQRVPEWTCHFEVDPADASAGDWRAPRLRCAGCQTTTRSLISWYRNRHDC
eukprot:1632440-Pyramimonas_sp.AAC.1